MLNNKSILITGGTGSFGKKFVSQVLKNYKPKEIIKIGNLTTKMVECWMERE